jgi:hypothetical protein
LQNNFQNPPGSSVAGFFVKKRDPQPDLVGRKWNTLIWRMGTGGLASTIAAGTG